MSLFLSHGGHDGLGLRVALRGARRVRSDADHAHVPLIAVTADADTSDTFDMSLFDGVVTKPATSAKIKEALSGVGC